MRKALPFLFSLLFVQFPLLANEDEDARNYFYKGEFKKAKDIWIRYAPEVNDPSRWVSASRDPNSSLRLFFLALSQYFLGEYRESLKTLDYLTVAFDVQTAFVSRLKGDNFTRLGENQKAVTFYREALGRDSTLLDVRKSLSELLAQFGDFNAAFIEARRYLNQEKDPKFDARYLEIARATTKPQEDLLKEKEAGFDVSWPRRPEFFIKKESPKIRIGLFADSLGQVRPAAQAAVIGDSDFTIYFEDKQPAIESKPEEAWEITFIETPLKGLSVLKKGGLPILTTKALYFKGRDKTRPSFLIKGVKLSGETALIQEPRQVRGDLAVFPREKGFLAVNQVDIEDYLLGVLPLEIGPLSPESSLAAQAVLARTYGFWRKDVDQSHFKRGDFCDLCDSVHCQVYKGLNAEHALAREPVENTTGEILKSSATIPRIWYHASCGGLLSDSATWDKPRKFQEASLPSAYSAGDFEAFFEQTPFWDEGQEWCFEKKSRFSWIRLVAREDLIQRTALNYPQAGSLNQIEILSRGRDSRVTSIALIGDKGRQIIDEDYLIRRALAPGALRSSLFEMRPISEKGQWKYLLFFGRGFGHGRGLCQVGAINQGAQGVSYREILKFYYPGHEIKKIY